MSSSTVSPCTTFSRELAAIRTLPDRLDRLVLFEKKINEFLNAHGSIVALDVAQALRKQQFDFKKAIAKETACRESVGTSTGAGPSADAGSSTSSTDTESDKKEEQTLQKVSKKAVFDKKAMFSGPRTTYRNDKKPLFHRC